MIKQKALKHILSGLLLAITFTTLALYIFEEDIFANVLVQIIFLVSPLIASICGIFLLRSYGLKSSHGKSFLLITLALGSWFFGDILWAIYTVILEIEPFPSYIDIFYLIGYPLFFIGFLKEVMSGKIKWTLKKVVLPFIVSIILIALTSYFIIYLALDPEASLLANIVSTLYGLGDVVISIIVLLLIVIAYEYKKGKMFFPWVIILVATLFLVVADILFAIFTTPYVEGVRIYQFIDLLWIGNYLLFAYGFFLIGFSIREIQNRFFEKLKREKTK